MAGKLKSSARFLVCVCLVCTLANKHLNNIQECFVNFPSCLYCKLVIRLEVEMQLIASVDMMVVMWFVMFTCANQVGRSNLIFVAVFVPLKKKKLKKNISMHKM